MNVLLSRLVVVAGLLLVGCSASQDGEWTTEIQSGQPTWIETGDHARLVFTGNATPWGNYQFHLEVSGYGNWPLFLNDGSCVTIERHKSTTQSLCLKDKKAVYKVEKDK